MKMIAFYLGVLLVGFGAFMGLFHPAVENGIFFFIGPAMVSWAKTCPFKACRNPWLTMIVSLALIGVGFMVLGECLQNHGSTVACLGLVIIAFGGHGFGKALLASPRNFVH